MPKEIVCTEEKLLKSKEENKKLRTLIKELRLENRSLESDKSILLGLLRTYGTETKRQHQ